MHCRHRCTVESGRLLATNRIHPVPTCTMPSASRALLMASMATGEAAALNNKSVQNSSQESKIVIQSAHLKITQLLISRSLARLGGPSQHTLRAWQCRNLRRDSDALAEELSRIMTKLGLWELMGLTRPCLITVRICASKHRNILPKEGMTDKLLSLGNPIASCICNLMPLGYPTQNSWWRKCCLGDQCWKTLARR